MASGKATFRVFISSTFSDLKVERNALQERVFPELRKLAAEHGRQFQAIDLRWGISQEASQDQQTMNICLGEIERCQKVTPRPNFLVLMGDRYGWMPPPPQIEAKEFEKIVNTLNLQDKLLLVWDTSKKAENNSFQMMYWDPLSKVYSGDQGWYRLDNNAIPPSYVLQPWEGLSYEEWGEIEQHLHDVLEKGAKSAGLDDNALFKYSASATHQEIRKGALEVGDADRYVHCFFREIKGLPLHFNIQAFQTLLDQQLAAEYPAGLPEPSFSNYIDEIKRISPSANAKEVYSRLKVFKEDARKGSSEKEFLEKVEGWLVDTCGKDFMDLKENDWTVDPLAHNRLKNLKQELKTRIPGNVKEYQSDWTGSGITNNHIDQLCEDVFTALSEIIRQEIEDPISIATSNQSSIQVRQDKALDEEGAAHRTFANERLANFVGRTTILEKISVYLKNNEARILTVYGDGGTGKSALAAKVLVEAQRNNPQAEIVYRFIGATPGSSDGRSLLDSLCREISRRYGVSELDIPLDYQDLVIELPKRMALADEVTPLFLILDSLDQLSPAQDVRNLSWLPDQLPPYVRVLTTTRQKEDTFTYLKAKHALLEELGGLSRIEGSQLLLTWLHEKKRTLQEPQLDAVLNAFEASGGTPLYLKLASEEARLWLSRDGLPPEELAVGIEGIIEHNLIDRLAHESNHGQLLVSKVLGYLAASRYGLAEDEIMDLLSRDLEMYMWFFGISFHLPADLVRWAAWYLHDQNDNPSIFNKQIDKNDERTAQRWLQEIRNPPERVSEFLKTVLKKSQGPRLPVVLWSRLFLDLEPYLSERVSENTTLLTFYHRELNDVSKKIFLQEDGNKRKFHKNLVSYFRFKSDPSGKKEWNGSYPRGLSELPHHQTQAEMWDEVYETLTDFRFLEEKAAKVGVLASKDNKGNPTSVYNGVFQLQEDFTRVLAAMSGDADTSLESGGPPLILTALEKNGGLTINCPVCNETSSIEISQLDRVIACPQPDCSRRLKINPFVIKVA